jgi:hypothetical protein
LVHRKSYLIDLGNSNAGPIGMVLRVNATSKREAIDIARKILDLAAGDCGQIAVPVPDEFVGVVDYVNIYVNPANISDADVDDDIEKEAG